MRHRFEFYQTAIHQAIPDVCRIWAPNIRGAKDNVLFAQTIGGAQYTFKFNGYNSAMRNTSVSRALINAGIPAPHVQALECDGQWCEVYPTLDGDTLYECIGRGITKTELQSIYRQLLHYFKSMSHIDFSGVNFNNLKYVHQSVCNDTTTTNGAILGNLAGMIVRLMNIGSQESHGLYHHGMTPKNILVSKRGKITGLLDIDEVGICNKNYAFGVLAAKASLIKIDARVLCDEYERMTGQKLNRHQISAIVRIQNMGRSILYKTRTK